MLCSASELELPGDAEGIMELPEDAPVGAVYAQWARLDDPVIDINLTPNRPDAAGVAGVARDLAAAGLGVLTTPATCARCGRLPVPGRREARFRARGRASRAAVRAAARARRQERPEPRLDAGAAALDRPAPDQRAGRHHQFSDASTARGRCMCSTRTRSRAISSCAAPAPARSCWRSTARHMSLDEDIVVIADDIGRRIARRRHGRRGLRLR